MKKNMRIAFVCLTLLSTVSCKCFDEKPDFYHKRYMYHNGQRLPIILESSTRDSHQLTNQVLRILLQEIIGYVDVNISTQESTNTTVILNRITGCPVQRCKKVSLESVPKTMVNLEVWMATGFNKSPWTDTGRLIDCGALGPYGRMAWFVPHYTVDRFWRDKVIVDHWRALFLPRVIKTFSWFHRLESLSMCRNNTCPVVHGPWCVVSSKGRSNCSTVFANTPDEHGKMLEEQIRRNDLPVDIVYLESHLHLFVRLQLKRRKPIMFYNWHPDVLTSDRNLTLLTFPPCHHHHRHRHHSAMMEQSNCDLDLKQMTKVVWYKLKTEAREAFRLIQKISFSQTRYEDLLRLYRRGNRGAPMQDAACRWLRENRGTWSRWIPTDLKKKTSLYLGGLFPLSGSYWTQPGLVEGARLALERVNQDSKILPNHSLELIVSDTQCISDEAMKAFIKFITDSSITLAGILGPGCSDAAEPIAALSKHFNMVVVSYGAEAEALSNRYKYPYFFRTISQVNHHRFVYGKFFKAMGWKHVAALAEGGQKFPEYHIQLQEYLKREGISVVVKRKLHPHTGHLDVSQIFADLRAQNVRVIIADFYVVAARAMMCEAYRQRMTAHQGYTWFLPSWYSSDWWDVDYYNSKPQKGEPGSQESVPCTKDQMEYAIDGHFILSKAFTDSDDVRVAGNITVGQYKDMYATRVGKADFEESPFASFVYDAVWVFAYGLDKLFRKKVGALNTMHDKSTVEALVTAINNTKFHGVSGTIQFEGSDRLGNVSIMQFFHNETDMRLVGRYMPRGKDVEGRLEIYDSHIRWLTPGGRRPDDGHNIDESCMIEPFRVFLSVTCEMSIIIANVMGFVAFIILTIVSLVLIKCKYDQKVRATHDRMKELGLLPREASHYFSLDDWEMKREWVVLNRKLGEGAFGTVYGGEAFVEGKGWVAVAVKTLKIGAIVEHKLDFFGEAEMMKRFKHPNIVELLGVCTREEPMYCIMEFLLHGDLKTYLLSRRNLVGLDMREADEVNAENLTQIAMNIASGLKYLHDLKYVHRDLACRNCLVHANKTVKIADFGMTRPTFDSDYYRFTRKGMLPVRWMSPESLGDGIFTSKSDIWSFGVVVYEIVTFGSFPYQGLSNSQVLEYVKSGNRLSLPDKVTEQLTTFIYECMSYEAHVRPSLDKILDYLDRNPKFLSPCLDLPMKSVVMEDTNSLEMALPSCQNTISLSTPLSVLNRRSGSSQEKLAGSRKTSGGSTSQDRFKVSVPLRQARSFVACATDPFFRRNSIGTPQALHQETVPLTAEFTRSNSFHRQFSAISDGGDRNYITTSSDYFSDTSKEMYQTITSL
ncbi:guanylate cyclase D-like [Gigantopelta aegis]|uniref:guanylate cyclase D-like n=1 Tax=Gigantopelta aegis TaxID=1735272 RepID=UPI001B88796C|nr:guanylate cyclase D-like [Gigantopelta aegis]